jgi:hypothetical protein
MKVSDFKLGRLGNAIFRYFASTLFCIIYNAKRTYNNNNECKNILSDDNFIEWSNLVLNNIIPDININSNFLFYGYYQHDNIFIKYKNEIIDYIIKNPTELLFTDGWKNNGNDLHIYNSNRYNYPITKYNSIDLIINPYKEKYYNFVVHLRLEDFIINGNIIHPISIKKVIDTININDVCLVVGKPKTELENKYINYFKKYYNITIESNSVIEDFHIMKNAKILICSCSTLSWAASLLSFNNKLVYFPEILNRESFVTFKNPNEKTIYYDFKKCNKIELENFLDNNFIKKDPYCSFNNLNEPIMTRILEYISNIENGYYVEIGVYDGIIQSTTKYLEDEFNWTGILIEYNKDFFTKLQLNRQNNINIYMTNYDFTQLFDYYELFKIDFLSISGNGVGNEYEIIKNINLNKYKPLYLLIEIKINQKDIIFNYLQSNNYFFLENITNYNNIDNPQWDGTHNDYFFKLLY